MKQTSAEQAINWYIGTYLQNENNAVREDKDLFEQAFTEMERLKQELKGKLMNYNEFLELVKQRGIHEKFYQHRKNEAGPYTEYKARVKSIYSNGRVLVARSHSVGELENTLSDLKIGDFVICNDLQTLRKYNSQVSKW
ncbi:MAG: hypothetical protein HYW50_02570 [Candidatus Diapherotrites archaeon]|nr:hypothetical protein [Candidatus Diapherotrites archaeon]